MNVFKKLFVALLTVFVLTNPLYAGDVTHSLPGVGGYDVVFYFQGTPVPGSGYHVAEYQGVSYLFANKTNKETFEANPEKYLPAYGGYCAYGAALGKKFYASPNVWAIVDGKLYLNLDKEIQSKWDADRPGYIQKANNQWSSIKDKTPADL